MGFKKIIKFCKEWKWAFLLISICLAGIPLTTIYGIKSVTWGNDFWPNALSEFLGMFVELIFGAIFTFVVIDKYIQYHKGLQWKKIKSITYKNLYFLMSNILLKLNSSFPKEMSVGPYILAEDFETLNDYLPKDDFDIFINSLIENTGKIIQQRHADSKVEENPESFSDEVIHSSFVKFKQYSKPDITTISNLIIPKLLTFSNDSELLDEIIELEELFTSLMSKINNTHKKNTNTNEAVKYIWLLKIQEILNRIKSIANSIEQDLDIN